MEGNRIMLDSEVRNDEIWGMLIDWSQIDCVIAILLCIFLFAISKKVYKK